MNRSETLPPYKSQSKLCMHPPHHTQPSALSPANTKPDMLPSQCGSHQVRPMLASEVHTAKISFSEMHIHNESGRKSVYVNYSNRKFPVLQTPWLASWGVESSAKFAETTGTTGIEPKLSMSLTLDQSVCGDNTESQAEVSAFETFLHEMDAKLVQMGCTRSMELFRKRAVDETTVREAMLTPLVRTSEKGVKRFKIHFSNYNPPEVYSEDGTAVAADQWESVVTGRMKVRAIIECKPVWFMSPNKYGCKWEVRMLQFAPTTAALSFDTYLFDTGKVPTTINVSGITFSDLKVDSKTNVKKILLNAPGGGPLRYETPWLNSYDGIAPPPSEYVKEGDPLKYSVKCPLKGDGEAETQLRAFLSALDEHVLEHAEAHSQMLFKKKMSKEVLRALYTPLLKEDFPALKASAPIYDNKWGFAAYNPVGERIETELHEQVTGRMHCRMILQNKGLWFTGARSFGCSWKISQLEFAKKVQFNIKGYAFREATPLDEPSEAVAKPSSITSSPTASVDSSPATKHLHHHSDDDEVVDSDME